MAKTISDLPLEWFDGEFYPPKEIRTLFSVERYLTPTGEARILWRAGVSPALGLDEAERRE